jgi:serine/threonine protein kinase
MELFEYPNLKQRIQQGIDPLAHQTEGIIHQAAEALAHVHQRGFLHRDVKPDNFLVSDEGLVKLIDFNLAERPKTGLAKLLGGKSKVQGTKSYMSPEQIRAQTLDVRSDIYSFGCLLHELLCGKVPFTGTSANELLTKHLRAPRPPLEPLNKNVTREFAALVRRMMAVDPQDRPATMDDILTELATTPVFRQRPSPPAELPSATKEDQS